MSYKVRKIQDSKQWSGQSTTIAEGEVNRFYGDKLYLSVHQGTPARGSLLEVLIDVNAVSKLLTVEELAELPMDLLLEAVQRKYEKTRPS